MTDRAPTFSLVRDAFGRLVLTLPDGTTHEAIVPVRAFPIGAPDEGLSLVSSDGHELVWLDTLDAAPPAARTLIEEELAGREFMPVIQRIIEVSTFATPSTWRVETDRGPTALVLKGEDDIRRLAGDRLLIADTHGIHYLVRNFQALDRHSRRLLDRFL